MKDLAKRRLSAAGCYAWRPVFVVRARQFLCITRFSRILLQWMDTYGEIAHSEFVFRAQMELLAREFHPISLDEAIKHIRSGNTCRGVRSLLLLMMATRTTMKLPCRY